MIIDFIPICLMCYISSVVERRATDMFIIGIDIIMSVNGGSLSK